MAKIKFFLRETVNPEYGTLYHMVLQGEKVLSRKSHGYKVPIKHWDAQRGRVKSSYWEAVFINGVIKDITGRFNEEEAAQRPLSGALQWDVVSFFDREFQEKKTLGLSLGSYKKYMTVFNHLKEVLDREFKEEKVPMDVFRDFEFIKKLREGLLVSRRDGGTKTCKGLKSYLLIIANVIEKWNVTIGAKNPISTATFTVNIGKDPKKYARALTNQEFALIRDFKPCSNRRGSTAEVRAHAIFMFQYWVGGMRIQDVLFLTNKCFQEDRLEVRIRKNKSELHFPVNFEMAKTLSEFHSEAWKFAIRSTVAQISISVEVAKILAELRSPLPLIEWDLPRMTEFKRQLVDNFESTGEREKVIVAMDELRKELEYFVSLQFFNKLKDEGEFFLFPMLNFHDFQECGLQPSNFTKEQERLIQNCRARHNSALLRITSRLGIEKVSGHTPRHTVARDLIQSNVSEEVIQNILGHASVKTTREYTAMRHPPTLHQQQRKQLYESLLKKSTSTNADQSVW
jgi:integrase